MASDDPQPDDRGNFATTRWTLVLAAGRGGSKEAREALASLCGAYWYPLYAFVRRLGHRPEEAQDLTQAFLAELLEKNYLRAADPERGRFRSFLLAAFRHFLAKERERAQAQKRGGGRTHLSLDFETGERRYSLEPAHELTAERLYEQRWALAVLDQVLARLREEFRRAGKADLFERLKGYLTGEEAARPYREAAAQVGTTEGAFKMAVHRLRHRFREVLLAEIAQTVAGPGEVEEELRHLFAAIRLEGP
jgi:RNA polymerase sigma-70 factor (ECF subfamily)